MSENRWLACIMRSTRSPNAAWNVSRHSNGLAVCQLQRGIDDSISTNSRIPVSRTSSPPCSSFPSADLASSMSFSLASCLLNLHFPLRSLTPFAEISLELFWPGADCLRYYRRLVTRTMSEEMLDIRFEKVPFEEAISEAWKN